MNQPLQITLKTLTPLWTGGVDQTADRLHETGIIGSLRWWYEALVRGLGGYACDPTGEDPQARCEFDAKAYEQAKKDGKTEKEAINAGLHNVCPVCYLFGTTGWARLFQLRGMSVPVTYLHFRTTLKMNQEWLKRVFGGESQNIDSLQVPYGDIKTQFIPRRQDAEYAQNQFALILRIATTYGGVGARMQHGFGQIAFPPELNDVGLEDGLSILKAKIGENVLRANGPAIATPFTLSNFISLTFEIPQTALSAFMRDNAHIGNTSKSGERRYVPCVFDLRYRGSGNRGMRQWLKKQKGWKETTNPEKLEELDLLLVPRSQWGNGRNQGQIDDDLRTAGRVFFGMPYQKEGSQDYVLRVWAFLPPEIRNKARDVQALKNLLEEYIQHAFGKQAKKVAEALGKDILATAGGAK